MRAGVVGRREVKTGGESIILPKIQAFKRDPLILSKDEELQGHVGGDQGRSEDRWEVGALDG